MTSHKKVREIASHGLFIGTAPPWAGSCFLSDQGQVHGKAAALLGLAGHLNASPGQFHDPVDDGKSQAQSLLLFAGVSLVVLFKNVGLDLRRHTRAGVPHPDGGFPSRPLQFHADLAPRRGIADGVVQKVEPHLPQQFLAAGAVHGFQLRRKGQVLFLPAVGTEDGAPADLLVQRKCGLIRQKPLGFQLGQKQGPVGQFRQPGGLLLDDAEILLPLLLGEIRLGKQLRKALDGGDRRFEFMGIAVDEVLPQGADALQFLRHAVEILTHIVQQLEAILLADENFESVTLSISDDSASFTAYAVDHCKRSSEKAAELYTTEFSNYPGMDVSVSPTSATSGMSAMGSTDNTTTVMLLGDDMDALRAGAEQVRDMMAQTPGVIRVENPFDQIRVKGHLEIDPQRALNAGTTPAAISMQVRYLLNGLTAATVDDGDQEYDIVLEYPKGKYEDVVSVMDYPIRTQTGKMVTLHDVADVTYDSTLPVLTRQDGQYSMPLTATTTDETKYSAANAISAAAEALDFPAGVRVGEDTRTSMQNDELSTMVSALLASLFLVFLVMAVQFNSVKMSIMVMMKEMSYIVIDGLIASTALAMFLVPPFCLLMRGERVDGVKRKKAETESASR